MVPMTGRVVAATDGSHTVRAAWAGVLCAVLLCAAMLLAPLGTDREAARGTVPGTVLGPADAYALASEPTATAHDVVLSAVCGFETQIDGLESLRLTVGEFKEAYYDVIADPQYDYVRGYSLTYRDNRPVVDDCRLVSVEIEYRFTPESPQAYRAAMKDVLDRIVDSVDANASEYDRARAAHDYILDNCEFGRIDDASGTAYGALILGQATNSGYASAYVLALQALGVEAQVVKDQKGVPWNLVYVEGAWYHVDVAWDDLNVEGGSGQPGSHLYFLCDDARMAGDHGEFFFDQEVPHNYMASLIGTTPEDRVALAELLWLQILRGRETSYEGIEELGLTCSEVDEAYRKVVADPLNDYVDSHGIRFVPFTEDGDDGIVTQMYATLWLEPEQLVDYDATMEAAIDSFLARIDPDASVYWKVYAVHYHLVRSCAYDESLGNVAHTAYGALVCGSAVCQGYSSAFELILKRLGIPCITVVSQQMNHDWNMVFVDGYWYHVDLTWDDPIPDRGPDDNVRLDNFLLGDWGIAAMGHSGWDQDAPEAPFDYGQAPAPEPVPEPTPEPTPAPAPNPAPGSAPNPAPALNPAPVPRE